MVVQERGVRLRLSSHRVGEPVVGAQVQASVASSSRAICPLAWATGSGGIIALTQIELGVLWQDIGAIR